MAANLCEGVKHLALNRLDVTFGLTRRLKTVSLTDITDSGGLRRAKGSNRIGALPTLRGPRIFLCRKVCDTY